MCHLFSRTKIPSQLLPSFIRVCLFSSTTTTSLNPSSSTTKLKSAAAYDDQINIAGLAGDFSRVQSLLSERYTAGFFNTSNTFKFISQSASPSSLLPPTLSALSLLTPVTARKNAFDLLVGSLSKSGHPHLARQVLDHMLDTSHPSPSVVSFYPLISALARLRRFSDVIEILSLMRYHSIPPDTTSYNYIIAAYCHFGDLSTTATILEEMVREGLKEDSLTFDALVLGACRAGRLDVALALVSRMEEDGVKVLYCTHAHVINGILKEGGYREAIEFVMAIAGGERRRDEENFGVLGRGLARKKRLEEVKVVAKEMIERGLEIDGMIMDAVAALD